MTREDIEVVIIDDEPSMVRLLSSYLEDMEYVVYSAFSGEEALSRSECVNAHLAICDMRMGGIDGEETIRRLHDLNPNMKFFIHTGSTNYTLSDDMKQLGITRDCFFEKPVFDLSIFCETIDKLLLGEG